MKALLKTFSDFTKEINIKEKFDIIEIDLYSKEIKYFNSPHSWSSNDDSVQRFFYVGKENNVLLYKEEGKITNYSIGKGIIVNPSSDDLTINI